MELVSNIIKSVLSTLYTNFGISLVLAFLFMLLLKQIREKGTKRTLAEWKNGFLHSALFRCEFLLCLYLAMILTRTVFCRPIWSNPLSDVMGTWGVHTAEGKLYTDNIENMMLFFPLTMLMLWHSRMRNGKGFDSKRLLLTMLWKSFVVSFGFSFCIEFCQLFFKVGTWQLTDLIFNTLGGVLGGLCYWVCYKVRFSDKKRGQYPSAASDLRSSLSDVKILQPNSFADARGYLSVLFDKTAASSLHFDVAQINQGYSVAPFTLHGLHYQESPHAQAKLVSCLRGSIYTVAVDVQSGSPTFGQYVADTISAEDQKMMYIPKGLAHGYLTLEPDTLMQWCVDEDFCAQSAKCVKWDSCGIAWPGCAEDYIISDKDRDGIDIHALHR